MIGRKDLILLCYTTAEQLTLPKIKRKTLRRALIPSTEDLIWRRISSAERRWQNLSPFLGPWIGEIALEDSNLASKVMLFLKISSTWIRRQVDSRSPWCRLHSFWEETLLKCTGIFSQVCMFGNDGGNVAGKGFPHFGIHKGRFHSAFPFILVYSSLDEILSNYAFTFTHENRVLFIE